LPDQRRAVFCGLGAVLCWSTVATAFKLSLAHLSPAQLLLVASLVSWLFLGAVLALGGKWHLLWEGAPRDYLHSLALGCINPLLYYLVLFRAYDLLPAQEAQALNYTWALTMALLAAPLLHHRLRPGELLAAGISYCGVVVIATRGQLLSLEFANPTGVGLALLSTLLWALYWILNTSERRDPVVALFLNFSFAVPLLFAWCLWRGEVQAMPWQGVAGAVYVGVFEMGLSFVLWLHAMRLTASTIRISSLIFISPPLSLVFIHFVLGEEILYSTLAGLALILGGLALQHLLKGK
jgi:drug/metabolite transporter (DMT)-like permease